MARSIAAFGDLELMEKDKKWRNNLCNNNPRCYCTVFHKQRTTRSANSSSHNATITAYTKEGLKSQIKLCCCFTRSTCSKCREINKNKNNCRLEDAESEDKKINAQQKETTGQMRTQKNTQALLKQSPQEKS